MAGSIQTTPLILVLAVTAVGFLHTLAPDHWLPIVAIARNRGWSRMRTARAAAIAAVGHVTSTLAIGAILWLAGAVLAARYAHAVNLITGGALLGFGGWVAIAGWRELQASSSDEADRSEHAHVHVHEDGTQHVHWHAHGLEDRHEIVAAQAAVLHVHGHAESGRTALLLVLGSSPMIEGLPAFAAASSFGLPLLATMAVAFALSTIATYVGVTTAALAGVEQRSLGVFERYGEMLSGLVIAAVGVYALVTAL